MNDFKWRDFKPPYLIEDRDVFMLRKKGDTNYILSMFERGVLYCFSLYTGLWYKFNDFVLEYWDVNPDFDMNNLEYTIVPGDRSYLVPYHALAEARRNRKHE